MPAPFYNAVKGTTAGTPGTGAFTPSAAASGFLPWSATSPPTGWMGLVRYEDGTAWELCYSYWNGTTLSRASNQMVASSTGSPLSLTSAATAAMVVDAPEVMSHFGGTPWRGWFPQPSATGITAIGLAAPAAAGTASASALAISSFYTEQPKIHYATATTANAKAGWSATGTNIGNYSTTAGRGGFEIVGRWGFNGPVRTPRQFLWGGASATWASSTAEPSAHAGHVMGFVLDTSDTNFQLMCRNNTSNLFTKVDTGIAPAADGWYESSIWVEPGGPDLWGLLMRLDTGAIWYGKVSSNQPPSNTLMLPQCLVGITSGGVAQSFGIGSFAVRGGV